MIPRILLFLALALLAAGPTYADDKRLPGKFLSVVERDDEGRATLLSIDVVQVELRELLQAIANEGRMNLVLADGVEGHVTIQLRGVDLSTALRFVAGAAGYGTQTMGNLTTVNALKCPLLQEHEYHCACNGWR
ncbi:MAG: hypothetical protein GY898_01435 [Proteobacteria bacterium]|nr:hypothetical protein [Pseudomonadota bacterium]